MSNTQYPGLSPDAGGRKAPELVIACGGKGTVRLTGLELADQKRSRLSRGELTPFGERGSAVLLEDIAAIKVTVLVEVIVGRSVNGGKLLQGL
jgi:hypothetical protein